MASLVQHHVSVGVCLGLFGLRWMPEIEMESIEKFESKSVDISTRHEFGRGFKS